jgi:hypothetical protein
LKISNLHSEVTLFRKLCSSNVSKTPFFKMSPPTPNNNNTTTNSYSSGSNRKSTKDSHIHAMPHPELRLRSRSPELRLRSRSPELHLRSRRPRRSISSSKTSTSPGILTGRTYQRCMRRLRGNTSSSSTSTSTPSSSTSSSSTRKSYNISSCIRKGIILFRKRVALNRSQKTIAIRRKNSVRALALQRRKRAKEKIRERKNPEKKAPPLFEYYGTRIELVAPPWDADCICVVEPGFPDRESWELRGISIVDQLNNIKL